MVLNSACTGPLPLATSSVAPAPCSARARPCLDVWWGEPSLTCISTEFRRSCHVFPHVLMAGRADPQGPKFGSWETQSPGRQRSQPFSCSTAMRSSNMERRWYDNMAKLGAITFGAVLFTSSLGCRYFLPTHRAREEQHFFRSNFCDGGGR